MKTAIACLLIISGRLAGSEMKDAIGKMKQFACSFTHGVRNGSELRRTCVHSSKTTQEVLDRVEIFFEAALRTSVAGDLVANDASAVPADQVRLNRRGGRAVARRLRVSTILFRARRASAPLSDRACSWSPLARQHARQGSLLRRRVARRLKMGPASPGPKMTVISPRGGASRKLDDQFDDAPAAKFLVQFGDLSRDHT